jgi:hypothetical protein
VLHGRQGGDRGGAHFSKLGVYLPLPYVSSGHRAREKLGVVRSREIGEPHSHPHLDVAILGEPPPGLPTNPSRKDHHPEITTTPHVLCIGVGQFYVLACGSVLHAR